MQNQGESLLELQNIKTSFYTKQGVIRAVDGVSFTIFQGEVVGLVGESGCGKSVTSLTIMGLVPQPAGKIISGRILFKGEDLLQKTPEQMRQLRGDRISMILQDPMVAMNQLLPVGKQLGETFQFHDTVKGSLKQMCIDLLRKVRVPAPELRVDYYPFQFSGGMSQRALIAMGIANNPDLLIADEPTTALDVTIAAQILKLMKDIQKETNASIILITHDLATVAQICTRVLVMYAGRIVESASIHVFYKKPAHPYSEGLLRSVPVLGRPVDRLFAIDGHPPNLFDIPAGCRFAPRCQRAEKKCFERYPPETRLEDNHTVACWLYAGE